MSSVRRRADQHMTEEEFEALILGTLPPADQADLEAHLAGCAECAEEYGNPRELLVALPFGAPDPGDAFRSEAIWQGIADRLEEEAPDQRPSSPPTVLPSDAPDNVVPFAKRDRGWGWRALAAVAVISLLLGGVIGQVLPRFGDEDEPETFTVEFTQPQDEAAATLSYLPDEEIFVFSVSGLPPPPEGYVYQAWLINAEGPIPTGTMAEGQEEMAAHGDKSQFTTFAITLEKGPLGSPQPTSDPIILADLAKQ
jgi:hypothetical protein